MTKSSLTFFAMAILLVRGGAAAQNNPAATKV
jgi:hypothetical protein